MFLIYRTKILKVFNNTFKIFSLTNKHCCFTPVVLVVICESARQIYHITNCYSFRPSPDQLGKVGHRMLRIRRADFVGDIGEADASA